LGSAGGGLHASGGVSGRTGGGEYDGRERTGENEVTSREGERPRRGEEVEELGDDESSGAGGSTKWNVREAIWICDLNKRIRGKDIGAVCELTFPQAERGYQHQTRRHRPMHRSDL
jgi:hypothetical protein